MKVALLTDTHFGARGDSPVFLDYFCRFYDEVFFRELFRRGIRQAIHLGDLVDRRKYINWVVADKLRARYINGCSRNGVNTIIIPGNHDCPFKNTLDSNAVRTMLEGNPWFTIMDEPCIDEIEGEPIAFLPWICQDNEEDTRRVIAHGAKSGIACMGHLELAGFEMYRGQFMEHGVDPAEYAGFGKVMSGHYHHKSSKGNVHYLGAPYEMTWADYDDERGFHIYDTDTMALEFVPNPLVMFRKVHFEDGLQLTDAEGAELEQKIIKLIVPADHDPYALERFHARLDSFGPADIQVVDDHLNLDVEVDSSVVSEVSNTRQVIGEVVKELDVPDHVRSGLHDFLMEIHEEATLAV